MTAATLEPPAVVAPSISGVPHIPVLRMGEAYHSLDTRDVLDLSTGETVARLSVGNAGLLRRDAQRFGRSRESLRGLTCGRLVEISADAARRFMEDTLPLGDGSTQTPEQYVACLSRTSGLPHTLVRANMAKVCDALTNVASILRGLTRGLPFDVIDRGHGELHGLPVSFYPTTDALGVVMPSNSPGVNALWVPALAMKTPVVIKPGSDEPWTPWRVMQAMIAAGIPAEALGFYPTDHEGAAAVTEVCDRSIVFGGEDTLRRHAGDPRVEVHGPGWSKVLLGEDQADRWQEHVSVIATSIAANSGRACINASTVVTPRHGRELAFALAEALAPMRPRPADDPEAKLSAIANPRIAAWADAQITEGLRTPGATDASQVARGGSPRLAEFEGRTYMQPTVIHAESWGHPLVNREFMFPYATVVELPQPDVVKKIGPTLVAAAITEDRAYVDTLLRCPHIQRLNLGPCSTATAQWEQPHEGNLFELLYHRRAIQIAESYPMNPSSGPAT